LLNFSNDLEKNRNTKFAWPIIVNQLLSNDLDTHSYKTKQQLDVKGFVVLAIAVGIFNFANKSGYNMQQSLLLALGSALLAGGGYHLATKKQVLYHPGLFASNNTGFTLPICNSNNNIY
jgi:peptidoglycan/LPS O-acetylase OafA/YrhL